MVKPRVLILRVAGINCDRETEWAFRLAGGAPERVHINEIVAGTRRMDDYQILVLPGGFSYGDDIGAGKVLANDLRYRIRDSMERFIGSHKPVLGICNGFQALVKAGLLPFPPGRDATLGWNESGRFEDRWVYLRVESSVSPFMADLPPVIRLPVAHAEGKFIPADTGVLARLEQDRQILLRYAGPCGQVVEYPGNPNGSVGAIAGVCDPSGLIAGMMPHPERCLIREHYPDWTRRDDYAGPGIGLMIFRNVVKYVL